MQIVSCNPWLLYVTPRGVDCIFPRLLDVELVGKLRPLLVGPVRLGPIWGVRSGLAALSAPGALDRSALVPPGQRAPVPLLWSPFAGSITAGSCFWGLLFCFVLHIFWSVPLATCLAATELYVLLQKHLEKPLRLHLEHKHCANEHFFFSSLDCDP